MEADSFESLLTRLDGGLEEGEFCPESEFLDLQGNFNLEYARIVDSKGVELLRDPDINLTYDNPGACFKLESFQTQQVVQRTLRLSPSELSSFISKSFPDMLAEENEGHS